MRAKELRLKELFDTFSINFAGPFPPGPIEEKYLLVAVKYLIGWKLACAINYDTPDEVSKVWKEDIIFCFGLPKSSVTYNERSFTANNIQIFIKDNNIIWKTFLEYAPMSNGRGLKNGQVHQKVDSENYVSGAANLHKSRKARPV